MMPKSSTSVVKLQPIIWTTHQ